MFGCGSGASKVGGWHGDDPTACGVKVYTPKVMFQPLLQLQSWMPFLCTVCVVILSNIIGAGSAFLGKWVGVAQREGDRVKPHDRFRSYPCHARSNSIVNPSIGNMRSLCALQCPVVLLQSDQTVHHVDWELRWRGPSFSLARTVGDALPELPD